MLSFKYQALFYFALLMNATRHSAGNIDFTSSINENAPRLFGGVRQHMGQLSARNTAQRSFSVAAGKPSVSSASYSQTIEPLSEDTVVTTGPNEHVPNNAQVSLNENPEVVDGKPTRSVIKTIFQGTKKLFWTKPLEAMQRAKNDITSALSGDHLYEEEIANDPILESIEKVDGSTHLLQDTLEMPGDAPLPAWSIQLSAETFPNPLTHPLDCHRRNRRQSFICDPYDILSPTAADRLEEILSEIRRTCKHPCESYPSAGDLSALPLVPCRIVIAVTREVPLGMTGNSMAEALVKKWNVGSPGCDDGVILLYSSSDEKPFIRWNSGENRHFTPHAYTALLQVATHSFRTTPVEHALKRSVALLEFESSGKVPAARRSSQFIALAAVSGVIASFFIFCIVREVIARLPAKRNQPLEDGVEGQGFDPYV